MLTLVVTMRLSTLQLTCQRRPLEFAIAVLMVTRSVSMLTLVVNMRLPTLQLGLVGQERALAFATAAFIPMRLHILVDFGVNIRFSILHLGLTGQEGTLEFATAVFIRSDVAVILPDDYATHWWHESSILRASAGILGTACRLASGSDVRRAAHNHVDFGCQHAPFDPHCWGCLAKVLELATAVIIQSWQNMLLH